MEVSVKDNGKGSGDWSCAHHEHMAAFPLFAEELSLPDSETVLLVRNHKSQGTVGYLFLNQGMGSDNDIHLAGLYAGVELLFLCGRDRSGQQNRPDR